MNDPFNIPDLPPGGSEQFIAEHFFAHPDNPPHSIRICGHPYTLDANRWAAFTEDELEWLSTWSGVTVAEWGEFKRDEDAFCDEIHAEFERRKPADGSE